MTYSEEGGVPNAVAVAVQGEAATWGRPYLPPWLSAAATGRALRIRRAKVYSFLRAGTWPRSERVNERRWRIRTSDLVPWYAALHRLSEAEAQLDLAMSLEASRRRLRARKAGTTRNNAEA